MNPHPYLRAYMAGIVIPTVFLLFVMTAFTLARFVLDVPVPIERVIVFPMALVPNLWGVWNMLYVSLHRREWSIGAHGALLPLLLVPAGLAVGRCLGLTFLTPGLAALVLPIGLAVYYLLWKHLVGFFNQVLGVAAA